MSKDGLGRLVRAAVVSGLLGVAGLTAVAGPAQAQDPSPSPTSPSPSPSPTDGGTDGTTGTDGATTTTRASTGGLPETGMDLGVVAVMGSAALAGTIGLRRLGRSSAS